MGVSLSPHQLNQFFREDNEYQYSIWTDGKKELALHYGAVDSAGAIFANRVSVLLGADGLWLLYYDPISDAGAHPAEVLEDCQEIFGSP